MAGWMRVDTIGQGKRGEGKVEMARTIQEGSECIVNFLRMG